MSRMDRSENWIIALAYLHRYGWLAAMLIIALTYPEQKMDILSIGCIIFSIWTLVGYKFKWKHIFCSYQNAYRQKMTPNSISWDRINKQDVYGVPLLFLFIGLLLLIV